MINEVDEALRNLVKAEVVNGADVEVAVRRADPGVGVAPQHADDRPLPVRHPGGPQPAPDRNDRAAATSRGIVVERRPVPRFFKLAYLITAWTQRPEDEHRLLSAVLACFMQYDIVPDSALTPLLRDLELRRSSVHDRLPALRRTARCRTCGHRSAATSSPPSIW